MIWLDHRRDLIAEHYVRVIQRQLHAYERNSGYSLLANAKLCAGMSALFAPQYNGRIGTFLMAKGMFRKYRLAN